MTERDPYEAVSVSAPRCGPKRGRPDSDIPGRAGTGPVTRTLFAGPPLYGGVSEEWICTNCERPYHEPPDECAICRNEVVIPREEYDARYGGVQGRLQRARGRLLEPMASDRSLVGESRVVQAAFLAIVALTTIVAVLLVVGVLLG
jgi:hypothetical protein